MDGEIVDVSIASGRHIVLTIYDVSNTKRRNRLVKCLESFGVRVQKSAFESLLTRKGYDDLVHAASKLIDANEDSLRFYFLTKCVDIKSFGPKVTHQGTAIIY